MRSGQMVANRTSEPALTRRQKELQMNTRNEATASRTDAETMSRPSIRRRRTAAIAGGVMLALGVLPQLSAVAHELTLVDAIDTGDQVASTTTATQSEAGPVCVQVRGIGGVVTHLRLAVTDATARSHAVEAKAAEGISVCSPSVSSGSYSMALTALAGQPGSRLYVNVLHDDVAAGDTFASTGDMAVERTGHSSTVLGDGKVLVVGGEVPDPTGILTPRSSSEVYDPATGTWTPAGSLSTYRYGADLVVLDDGRVAAFGGVGAPLDRERLVEVFDPTTGTWSELGSLSGRNDGTATLLPSGKVLLFGTMEPLGNSLTTYEVFDPASGASNVQLAATPYRTGHTATALNDGRVLLAGGKGDPPEAAIFDPASGSFAPTGAMHTARTRHEATLLTDGRVVASGGREWYGGAYLSDVEIYDPETDAWTAVGHGMGGEGHTATALTDGRVLSINSAYSQTSAVVLDPSTGTVSQLGSQPTTGRSGHSATRLADGRVLLAGGGGRYYSTASSEIFTPMAP